MPESVNMGKAGQGHRGRARHPKAKQNGAGPGRAGQGRRPGCRIGFQENLDFELGLFIRAQKYTGFRMFDGICLFPCTF